MNHALRPRRLVTACSLAAASSLVFAAPSLGASVELTDPSPPSGAVFQSTDEGVSIPIAWTSEAEGCRLRTPVSVSIDIDSSEDGEFLVVDPSPVPESGEATLSRTGPLAKTTTFTWSVRFSCVNQHDAQAPLERSTEPRTVTVLAPDSRPRAAGPYRVSLRAKLGTGSREERSRPADQNWTFKPLCASGPCASLLNINGVGNVNLDYDETKQVWSGAMVGNRIGMIFSCQGRSGAPVRGGLGGSLTIKVRGRKSFVQVSGAQTQSTRMLGTVSGVLTPNARGKAQGCAPIRVRGSFTAVAR